MQLSKPWSMFERPWALITKVQAMGHDQLATPSPWVRHGVAAVRSALPAKPRALDLACGGGRHAAFMAMLGFDVLAVDISPPSQGLTEGVVFRQLDLEQTQWPLEGEHFDLIVVTNYLHRPHFEALLRNLQPSGGVIIYETFMQGNAQFGSPRNPDFLLKPGELLSLLGGLNILAFEQGFRAVPSPAMIQRAVAISGDAGALQSGTINLMQRD